MILAVIALHARPIAVAWVAEPPVTGRVGPVLASRGVEERLQCDPLTNTCSGLRSDDICEREGIGGRNTSMRYDVKSLIAKIESR